MSSIYDEHEEEPQTTDNSVKKPPPNTVVLMPRRMPQSLHEARVIANSVRVAPGRYRVMSPPLTLSQNQTNSSSRIDIPSSVPLSAQAMDSRPRRPIKAAGDGQQLGKPFFPATQFSKIVELLPNRQKRRVYFPDDDETCEEHSPKKLRVIKRVDLGRYKKFEDTNSSNCSSKEDNQSHSHVLPRTEDGELGKPMLEEHGDYVEEVVDVMDEDCSVTGSMIPTMDVMRSLRTEHGLPRLGQLNLVRQLKGENNYLKEQLDASFYRIKQLEALLLDRNQRLKQLLAENVQMSVRLRRLTSELGEDAARELLNPPNTEVITR